MTDIELSVNKNVLNSACSSEDFNRSTVKRLFSSVFSIIDNDQEVSYFDEEEHKTRVQRLLENQVFVGHLQNKLRAEGLCDGYSLPIIRFSLKVHSGYAVPHPSGMMQKAELDYQDMHSIFSKFGQINKIVLTRERKDAYIFYNSFLNAYISFKMLKSVNLRGGSLEVLLDWVRNNEYHPEISSELHSFLNKLNWESLFEDKLNRPAETNYFYGDEPALASLKQNKLTCRYDIQIENEREFQVARRIIGSKGCNMKRIIQESISNDSKAYPNDNTNQLLKLRLRGKGSGYKEGPQQQESNESLHLCVSAKDEMVYSNACGKVEKLLANIYSEYMDFTRKQGRIIELIVKKINIGQSNSSDESSSNYSSYPSPQTDIYDGTDPLFGGVNDSDVYRIAPQKIAELLELRNKARRELNFSEADRIRNYLRSCGVCLIDEKGRRGKAAEVTTWKYLY